MLITVFILLTIIVSIAIFINQPQFGKLPTGTELERVKHSSNYRDGKFQNIHDTPNLEEGVSYYTVMRKFFFAKSKRSKPAAALPSAKADLHTLPADKDILVWFGHSSYFIQVDGKKILVDPVFSGSVSPIRITTKSFKGTDVYSAEDMPVIDYLFISHDHWDHLDYDTMLKLKPKVKTIITGLGVPAHLHHWGFDEKIIIEKDWNEEVVLEPGFIVNTISGRHFSGRKFNRNQSIWLSFVLTTPAMKIFIGGDSGYDTHFKEIGERFGAFDIAMLECGQYNEYWRYIHMMPEEVVQAAIDLQAKKFMPVHWGKFSIALHDWDDPIVRVTAESKRRNVPVITPIIGAVTDLDNSYSTECGRELNNNADKKLSLSMSKAVHHLQTSFVDISCHYTIRT